jgi:hypothetical protein
VPVPGPPEWPVPVPGPPEPLSGPPLPPAQRPQGLPLPGLPLPGLPLPGRPLSAELRPPDRLPPDPRPSSPLLRGLVVRSVPQALPGPAVLWPATARREARSPLVPVRSSGPWFRRPHG